MKNRCLPRAGRRAAALLTSLVLMLTLLPTAALAAESVAVSPENFPDANFLTYVAEALDKDGDGALSADEIAAVTEIDCDNRSIASLEGIGYFTNLETLSCRSNQLTTLDVSRNTQLTKLLCSDNQLTVLDVSANTALTYLACGVNQLTALDLSTAPALESLICGDNQLTELNVSANPALTTLRCIGNCLTELDVSKNPNLEILTCSNNQLTVLNLSANTALTELSCSDNQLTSLDLSRTQVTSYNQLGCSGNQYTLDLKEGENTFDLTKLPGGFDVSKVGRALNMSGGEITGNTLTVKPGAEMVRYQYACREGLWADFAWKVHADTVRKIGLTQTDPYTFPELTAGYTSVSPNKFLIRNTGNVATGPLKVVLEGANADAFRLASQDGTLSADGSIAISSIGLIGTAPTVSVQPAPGLSAGTYTANLVVKSADDDDAALSEGFSVSVTVKAVFEPILAINAENFPDPAFLQYINECYMDTDKDGYLSAEELAKIRTIDISRKGVKDLTGLAHFTALENLFCYSNDLTVLDLSGNPALTSVNCSQNRLTSLDFGSNPRLNKISADGSIYQITLTEAGTFDLSGLPGKFDVSKASGWTGGTVSGTTLTVEEDAAFVTYTYDPGNGLEPVLFTLLVTGREAAPIPINETTFPDASFRKSVKSEIDRNGDGKLSTDEIIPIRKLDAKYDLSLRPNIEGLTDLTGIEYFTELESLTCKDYQLTSLDLSRNTKLTKLDVSGNEYRILLTEAGTFDLSGLPGKFDASKASGWTGGTVSGTILTVEEGAREITYTYDCGGGFTARFTLKVRYPGVKIAAPVISPAGGIYNEPVTVSITCATPDASIYYIDGNYKFYYRGPFVLYESARITAWAEDENGDMEDSERVTATFSIVEAGHVHDYSQDWTADSTGHWHACQCLQQADFAPHTFQWIIDREATRTETGAKHEECSVCDFIQSEGTVIDKLPGGSSGGGGGTSYAISVDSGKNGTITVSPKSASRGNTVTITVTPDKGYTLETLTVLDQNGRELSLTEKDGKYTFTMPASKVTVRGSFMEDNAMLNFFVDVPADTYYYDAVLWAAEKGITVGTDALHFSPGLPCTRAQIVTFLWRTAGSPDPAAAVNPFADVPAEAYYAKAVLWAVENGITNGTAETAFSPDAACTRAQCVAFLYRSAIADGLEAVTLQDLISGFGDAADLPGYAVPAMNWALSRGIVQGNGGALLPNGTCTRAQIVTFLFRMHQGG